MLRKLLLIVLFVVGVGGIASASTLTLPEGGVWESTKNDMVLEITAAAFFFENPGVAGAGIARVTYTVDSFDDGVWVCTLGDTEGKRSAEQVELEFDGDEITLRFVDKKDKKPYRLKRRKVSTPTMAAVETPAAADASPADGAESPPAEGDEPAEGDAGDADKAKKDVE